MGGYDKSIVSDINRFRWYSIYDKTNWNLKIKSIYLNNDAFLYNSDSTFIKAKISIIIDAIYVKTNVLTALNSLLQSYSSKFYITVYNETARIFYSDTCSSI